MKTILKQDIAFFDTQTTTGEVVGRMSRDTVLIQEAIGEKVGKFIQWTSAFVGGVVIAFVKGWKLALVLMACIPALVITGVVLTKAVIKLSSRTQMAYAKAEDVVEQTVSTIRTVRFSALVLLNYVRNFFTDVSDTGCIIYWSKRCSNKV